MATPQWTPVMRDYEAENIVISLARSKDAYGQMQHPLLPAPPKLPKPAVVEVCYFFPLNE